MKNPIHKSFAGFVCAALAAQLCLSLARADEVASDSQAPETQPVPSGKHLPNKNAGTRNIDGMTVRTNSDGTVEVTEPSFGHESFGGGEAPQPVQRPPRHKAPAKKPPAKAPVAQTPAKPNQAIDSYIKKYKPYVQSMEKGKHKSHLEHGQLLTPKKQ